MAQKKNTSPFVYALIYVPSALLLLAMLAQGYWAIVPLLFVLLGIPLFDLIGGNLAEPDIRTEDEPRFTLIIAPYGVVFLLLLVGGIITVAHPETTLLTCVALTISFGVVSGSVGMAVAHELIHRRTFWLRTQGQTMLIALLYYQYYVEHLQGHHAKAATYDDPSSARRNETVYAFLPRTLIGTWRSAYEIECRRLGKRGLNGFSIHNRLLRGVGLSVLLVLAVYSLGGLAAVGLIVGQAVIAILILEMTNYVEHYGLTREKDAQGRYQSIGDVHSWNATPRISGYFLLKIQCHSDHHIRPARKFESLEVRKSALVLPAGYVVMVPITLIPPLWRRLTHPLIDKQICAQQAGAAPTH